MGEHTLLPRINKMGIFRVTYLLGVISMPDPNLGVDYMIPIDRLIYGFVVALIIVSITAWIYLIALWIHRKIEGEPA
jgi:hypothetical protein